MTNAASDRPARDDAENEAHTMTETGNDHRQPPPGRDAGAPGPDRHARYPHAQIRAILNTTRTIALVGASANPARPSWIVLKYLLDRGYAVTPVNPGLAGQDLLGRRVAASLAEVQAALGDQPIDLVEIFRNTAAAGPLVDEALSLAPLPKVIWMQLGVRDDAAAARAEARAAARKRGGARRRCPPSVGGGGRGGGPPRPPAAPPRPPADGAPLAV